MMFIGIHYKKIPLHLQIARATDSGVQIAKTSFMIVLARMPQSKQVAFAENLGAALLT